MSHRSSRRSFLQTTGKTTAGVTAGLATTTLLRDAKAGAANDKVNVALIGCGGQGNYDLGKCLDNYKDTECIALCDVDDSQLAKVADNVAAKRPDSAKPERVKDFRRVLDNKDVHAVFIGTPDHWHAIPMILACQAGKDVYVQKPCCHNIAEGRVMVDAAKKYERVVQVGTQQRSGSHFKAAVKYIQQGKLGKISMTKTFTYGNETISKVLDAKDEDSPPPGVDYDMWLGPAPERKFNRNRFHNNFRWFFDYAAGMVGDWNVHLQDIVVWAMGNPQPKSVNADGGKLVLTDNRDTPDTMVATYDYGDFVQVYELRKASGPPWDRKGYGIEFHGTNGKLFVDRSGWNVDPDPEDWKAEPYKWRTKELRRPGSKQIEPHIGDFLKCIKSRKQPIANIADHFVSVSACHLANISIRVGRKIYWDATKEQCFSDAALTTPDAGANALLKREYRKGYELPTVEPVA
jgi:predicted dehydrogenase